jgi:hypothetical protein
MNTTSPERLAANRANAQKSTGPKTPEGRAASRMNALKHGLLSQEVLVSGPHRQESEAELFALHDWFRDELQPMGPIEAMLVDQIVTTHWRLRRVLAAESAEMTLSLRRGWSQSRGEAERKSTQVGTEAYELTGPLDENAAGCREAQRILRDIAKAVRREGGLTERILGDECSSFGPQLNILQDMQELLDRRVANPDGVEEAAWAEQHQTEVLDYLDDKIREMTLLEAEHHAAALMPSAEVLAKLGRYETMLNRQLHRAMTQFAKLQKERRKEEADRLSDDSFWKQLKLPKLPRIPPEGSRQRELLRNEAIARLAQNQGVEKLPNEAIAQRAVQSSEFKVQSSEELPNEATEEPENVEPRMEHGLNTDKNLPNEAIPASQPSERLNLRSEMSGDLPNEATRSGS